MDELVKRLREIHPEEYDDEWEFAYDCQRAMNEAADAIEELQKRVPKKPHGRLIDADALVEDLKYDVELDAVALDSMEIVGDERRKIQDDKDFKQNCIFWIKNAPTIIPAEEGK